MRIALFLMVLMGLLSGCAVHQWQPNQYTVKKGDTLYAIAWRYRLDYQKLARWNQISSPYVIKPGQKIWMSRPSVSSVRKPAVATARNDSRTARPSRIEKTPAKPSRSSKPNQTMRKVSWRWPLEQPYTLGKKFAGPTSVSQGIDIHADLGKAILAAASGEVVYSGNGLIGYGNLVIVKHNDMYLSAYALNQKIHVKEGQKVVAGQKIASMGFNVDKKPTLHFEIRRYGKPVDPIKYLP